MWNRVREKKGEVKKKTAGGSGVGQHGKNELWGVGVTLKAIK